MIIGIACHVIKFSQNEIVQPISFSDNNKFLFYPRGSWTKASVDWNELLVLRFLDLWYPNHFLYIICWPFFFACPFSLLYIIYIQYTVVPVMFFIADLEEINPIFNQVLNVSLVFFNITFRLFYLSQHSHFWRFLTSCISACSSTGICLLNFPLIKFMLFSR